MTLSDTSAVPREKESMNRCFAGANLRKVSLNRGRGKKPRLRGRHVLSAFQGSGEKVGNIQEQPHAAALLPKAPAQFGPHFHRYLSNLSAICPGSATPIKLG